MTTTPDPQQGPPPGWQQTPPPAAPQPKGRKGCFWWIGLIVVAVVAIVIIVAVATSDDPNATHKIELKATGTGPLDVTYSAQKLGSGSEGESENPAKSPWSKTVEVQGDWSASIIVNLADFASGEVTCEIIVDGESKAKHSAKGDGAVATCLA